MERELTELAAVTMINILLPLYVILLYYFIVSECVDPAFGYSTK